MEHADKIIQHQLSAPIDKNPISTIKNWQIRRYKTKLYLIANHQTACNIDDISSNLECEIFFRKSAQDFNISNHHLKRIFQKYSIPPWVRNNIPIILYNKKIIGVWGFFICNNFKKYQFWWKHAPENLFNIALPLLNSVYFQYNEPENGENSMSDNFAKLALGEEILDLPIITGTMGTVSYTHLTLPTICSV